MTEGQRFREYQHGQMRRAGLLVADVVLVIFPDGQKQLVWGAGVLQAIVEANKAARALVAQIPVNTEAEAQTLAQQYWAVCGAKGSA